MKNVLATFEDAAEGVKAHVAAVPNGFSVAIEDTDSGEFVPSIIIYRDLEAAVAYAKKCVRFA